MPSGKSYSPLGCGYGYLVAGHGELLLAIGVSFIARIGRAMGATDVTGDSHVLGWQVM